LIGHWLEKERLASIVGGRGDAPDTIVVRGDVLILPIGNWGMSGPSALWTAVPELKFHFDQYVCLLEKCLEISLRNELEMKLSKNISELLRVSIFFCKISKLRFCVSI
jgi:hypothetical protein